MRHPQIQGRGRGFRSVGLPAAALRSTRSGGHWQRSPEGIVLFDEEAEAPDEEIFGADSRQRIRATDKAPYRFICALDLYFGVQPNKGTGLLISPRHVLTAAHNVLVDAAVTAGKITVFPGLDGTNLLGKRQGPVGSQDVAPGGFWIPPAYVATRDPAWDFALLRLPREFPPFHAMTYGYWGDPRYAPLTRIRPVTAAALLHHDVSVSGYPADKCKEASCAACAPVAVNAYDTVRSNNTWATTQWAASGAVRVVPASGLILYDADTCKGMSGGPVWRQTAADKLELELVAVHTGHEKALNPRSGVVETFNKGVPLSAVCLDLLRQRLLSDCARGGF